MSSIDGISGSIIGSIRSQSSESRQDPAEKFKELDSDGSGGLDKTELSSLAQELSKMIGKTLDVDSSITSYDANEDGELSREEMASLVKDTLGAPPEMGQDASNLSSASGSEDNLQTLLNLLEEMNQQRGGMQGAPPAGPPPDPAEKFAELDTDANGTLSQDELDAMATDFAADTGQTIDMTDAISSYDTDGDGELNQDEMDTMMQAQREAGGVSSDGNSSMMRLASNTYQATSNMDRIAELRQLMEEIISSYSSNTGSDTSSS